LNDNTEDFTNFEGGESEQDNDNQDDDNFEDYDN